MDDDQAATVTPRRVTVIGGGITGLAAAYQLAADIGPGAVTLIERDGRLGGKIVTEHIDGFVIEGGPDCFLAVKPGARELCRELGLEGRLRGTNPHARRSFIKRGGRLLPLPEGLTGLIPSRLGPLVTTSTLSLAGRVRAGLEVLVPRRRGDQEESIAAFAARRFGREAYHWLMEPLLGGIYAGDGAQLSLAATFPHLIELERTHGGVLRGMMRRGRAPQRTGPAFLTPAEGLQEIVTAIERHLNGARIRTGTGVTAIRRREHTYRVELDDGSAVDSEAVICSVPAFAAAELVQPLDGVLAAMLRDIRFVSTATVSLGFDGAELRRRLDGYGYVVPRAAGGPVVACTWTSTKFPSRAPADAALIRVFVGRDGHDHVLAGSDEELVKMARAELRETLDIRAAPRLTRVFRWPQGIPQYTLGHVQRIERIEARTHAHAGLFLAGASYRGVGIPDCIEAGRSAARAAVHGPEAGGS